MKKIQNQEPKLVTLKHVVSRASKDKVFLNSLLKAPKSTLRNNALQLSEANGKKLNTLITKYRRVKILHSDLHKYSKQLSLNTPASPSVNFVWGDPL
jgi:hypothetical protein